MKTKKEIELLKQFAESLKEMHEQADISLNSLETELEATGSIDPNRLRINLFLITGVFDGWVDFHQEIFDIVAPLLHGEDFEENAEDEVTA